MFNLLAHRAFCLTASFLMGMVSCPNVTIEQPTGGDDSGSTAPDPTDPVVPMNVITVRFINETSYGLDVQFYAAAALPADVTLAQLPAVLFAEGNRITEGLGLSGQGVIPAGDSDSTLLDCGVAAAIGTKGGLLLGPEGEEVGFGTQRYATVGNYVCGDVLTFYFRTAGDGFETLLVTE